MQLSVKDLSKFLNVTERTIYRWIKQESIPFYRVHDQYRFNRVEILDWATVKKINLSPEILSDIPENDIVVSSLAQTLKKGGIYYHVAGKDKKALLRAAINLLSLPEVINKENILNAIFFLEELGSTGVGEGIAIPHARYPIVTDSSDVIVSICFSENPVDFGAIDGKPVNCLFTLISPNVRTHLKMLSQIAFVLKDEKVKNTIITQQAKEIIVKEIERVEQSFK